MIDVTHQISAVQRRVGTRTLAAGEARIVVISQTYDAAVADVWDACTNADRIPRWFLPVSGELKPGGRYQLEGHAGGTIERCDPAQGAAWAASDEGRRFMALSGERWCAAHIAAGGGEAQARAMSERVIAAYTTPPS
jgi:uncharacterized protein YndB with AHSA1/START domain